MCGQFLMVDGRVESPSVRCGARRVVLGKSKNPEPSRDNAGA
jgi:hypothetical protein